MAIVFLSYRRADATGWAGRLHDSLVRQMPGVKIFMDMEEIPPGVRFADYIHEAVGACDVLLALIGPSWLSLTNEDGIRRLDDPEDFVRLEIAAALARGVRVIPTLVGGAAMPSAKALPEPLKALCDRQNYEITDRAWEDGCARLAKALNSLVHEKSGPAKPQRGKAYAAAGVLAALALAGGLGAWLHKPGDASSGGPPKPDDGTKVAVVAPVPAPAQASAASSPAVPAEPAAASMPSQADASGPAVKVVKPARIASTPAPATTATDARSAAAMDEELWAAASASNRRSAFIDYLFRFHNGIHAAAASTRAGGFWAFDPKGGCGLWVIGQQVADISASWSGACRGGKADGGGRRAVDAPAQKLQMQEETTLAAGLSNGACSSEDKIEGTLRRRQRGTCHAFTDGDVLGKFDGTIETFGTDGSLDNTFVGTMTIPFSGARSYRGERTFSKTGTVFTGAEKGDEGDGSVKYSSGVIVKCKFIKGKANGPGCELQFPNGNKYQGELLDGKQSGQGLLTLADGSGIIGRFARGKLDGDVVIVARNGQRTNAHFVAGTRDK